MADIRVKDLPEAAAPGVDYYFLADSATDGPRKIKPSNSVTKADIGLGNVDNTSDASKPISTATQAALDAKATAAQGAKADTAVQPADLGSLATKNKVGVADIDAVGTPSGLTFYRGDDVWATPAGGGNVAVVPPAAGDAGDEIVVTPDGTGFQIMKRTERLPDDFGWKASDTLANRHAAMVAWAADSRPGKLDRNTDYQIDTSVGSLIVAAGKIIDGHGAYIYDTTTNGKLITLNKGALDATTNLHAGNWQIGNLRLRGYGAQGFSTGGYGIFIEGTDNHDEANPTATVFPNYVIGGLLDNISMENIGFVGLWQRFVRDARRNNIKVDGVGYAGQLLISEIGYRGTQNISQNIGPGTEPTGWSLGIASTCYGFAFSRQTQGGRMANLTTTPRSADCIQDQWRVINNPYYTACDTHAGDAIKIINGYAFNVFKGINIGYEADDANCHGSINCSAINNKLTGVSTGTIKCSPGLINVGYASAAAGYTRGIIFDGNFIQGFGDYSSDNSGGIWLRGTKEAKVVNNVTEQCRPNGLTLESDNIGFQVSGNTNKNAHGATAAAGIHVYGNNNVGVFGPNSAIKEGYWGEPTMTEGYSILSGSGSNKINFLGGDYFETTDTLTQYSIASGAVIRKMPRDLVFTATIPVTAGAANGTVSWGLPEGFTVAPKGVLISGPSVADSQVMTYGYSAVTTTTVTLTAFSLSGALVNGANIDVTVTVKGW